MQNFNEIFFSSGSNGLEQDTGMDYDQILNDVQRYCTQYHTDAIADSPEAKQLLREYIEQYVIAKGFTLSTLTTKELCDRLYNDMAGYSFLEKWLQTPGLEELNINSYDSVEIITSGGRSQRIKEKFTSPQQSIDVIRRMLTNCGMIIDDTMPSVLGHLKKNVRISVDKSPIADADAGLNASIRIVNPQTVSRELLLSTGAATAEMLDFISACLRYGTSMIIAGATGSGKTSLMGYLLSTIPDNLRVITIEEGSREFDLVRRDADGNVTNSVVQLLTRPNPDPALNIDQEFLLARVLRKHPNIIGIGEMRAAGEAMAACQAAMTSHTVISTIHASSAVGCYDRMMVLAKSRSDLSEGMLMRLMVEAFPIAIYVKQLEDGSRRIMEVIHAEQYDKVSETVKYNTLFQYRIEDNIKDPDGNIRVVGRHIRNLGISETMKQQFLDNGMPASSLRKLMKGGN